MVEAILVVTSAQAFGELIRQSLEDTRRYRVTLAAASVEALALAKTTPFALAILDADALDVTLGELWQGLRAALPGLRWVVIPPENDLAHRMLDGLSPDGCLSKPFYAPDLLDTVTEVLEGRPQTDGRRLPTDDGQALIDTQQPHPPTEYAIRNPPHASPPAWLEDISRAAQQLARLSLETAAQAALIVKGAALWAYAGQLPQPAAQELAVALAAQWSRGNGADLARYVQLAGGGDGYMLYATALGGDMALALAFDAQTPFSKMRSQAGRLAKSLAEPPEPPEPLVDTPPLSSGSVAASVEEDELIPLSEVAPLFDDVPPPVPLHRQTQPVSPSALVESPARGPVARLAAPSIELEQKPQPAPAPAGLYPAGEEDAVAFPTDDEDDTRPTRLGPMPALHPLDGEYPYDSELTRRLELQPITPAVCSLHYSCLLIPRLPLHHLTGELAAHISEWAAQICLAFGWRMEGIAVRPEYLQWIVAVPPNTSPGYLMRVMRQQTAQRIFSAFPQLALDNPSGDFWAPGYLIMSAAQPPPPQVVKDFIHNTRRYQGAAAKVEVGERGRR